MFKQIPCAACKEPATGIINVVLSPTNRKRYAACLEHRLVAQNSLFEFLKHIKNKAKRARKARR